MSKFKEYIEIFNEMISDEEASKNAKMMYNQAGESEKELSKIDEGAKIVVIENEYFGTSEILFFNFPKKYTRYTINSDIKEDNQGKKLFTVQSVSFFYKGEDDKHEQDITIEDENDKSFFRIKFSLFGNTQTSATFLYPFSEAASAMLYDKLRERLNAKEGIKNKLAEKLMKIKDVNNVNEIKKIAIDNKEEMDNIIENFYRQLRIKIIDTLKSFKSVS